MIKFGAIIKTAGDGFWSTHQQNVQCTIAEVSYVNSPQTFGELRVYFDTNSWNVDESGLIYTDDGFLAGVHEAFKLAGFDPSDIEYSEQGMQGDNYVSMDVGEKFLTSWEKIVG